MATSTFVGSRRPFHLYGGCRVTIMEALVLQLPTFIGGPKFPSLSWQAGNYTRTMKSSPNTGYIRTFEKRSAGRTVRGRGVGKSQGVMLRLLYMYG